MLFFAATQVSVRNVKQEAFVGKMMKPYFSRGVSLAVLALAVFKQVDAFVVTTSGQAVYATESQALFALPKVVKKGQKVVTEPDVGGAVQALVSIPLLFYMFTV